MSAEQPYDSDFTQSESSAHPESQLVLDETNSLQDLLRNAPSIYGSAAETNDWITVTSREPSDNLHLDGSVNTDAEDENGSTHAVPSQPPTPTDPSKIPLPVSGTPSNISLSVSRTLSTQRSREGDRMVDSTRLAPSPIEEKRPQSYKKTIKNAGKVLEHIKNGSVGLSSRHVGTSITYYDYRDHLRSDPTHIYQSGTIAALGHVPKDVQQRLILVEDLSNPMIDQLGENFGINPEFFEEHLLNSGYAGGKYDSPPARNWSTASFEKSYLSFRWIRPVYRLPTYFSSGDLEDLLQSSVTHFTREKSVTTEILTNIFRLDWALWTNPTTTAMMKRVCGLEERVSIWRKKLIDQETEIVIVLLDPLPEISEEHHYWTSSASQLENDENKDQKEKKKEKKRKKKRMKEKDDSTDDDDSSRSPSIESRQHLTPSSSQRGNVGKDSGYTPHPSSVERSTYREPTSSRGRSGEYYCDDSTPHSSSVERSIYRESTSSRKQSGEYHRGDDTPHHSSTEQGQYWTPPISQRTNGQNDSQYDASYHSFVEPSRYWESTGSWEENGQNDGDDTPHQSFVERNRRQQSISSQEGNSENYGDDDVSHYSSTEQRMYIEDFIIDEEQPQRVRDEKSFAQALGWILGRERRRNYRPGMKREVLNANPVEKKRRRDTRNKVIIEQIAPRQTVSADLDRIFQSSQSMADLQKKLQETKSTKTEICDALEMHQGPISLVRPLIRIIRQDTLTLINQLRQVLDEIDIEILDDIKMEDRLSLWRQIINRAQRELPELKDSMEPFIEFLIKLHPPSSPLEVAATGLEARQDMHELGKDIDQIILRLSKTSASVTSNMGLLESRRSIDEAHAVARLTELAFIFIPMSFAASIFGMQIEPFANPVPLSNFFVVAIVVTSFAYAMRMTMRSHWLIALKTAVKKDVRDYAARNGQPVQPRALPMLLVFRSIASRLGTIISSICKWVVQRTRLLAERFWGVFGFIISFVLLNAGASAIPIGVLWTRELESNTRAAVSIAIVFLVIATVGIPFWMRSEPEFRNALPKLIMKMVRRAPWQVKMALMYVILTTTFIVVPLALIWTRPLAIGIKSGLTVGILTTVIIIMLVFVLLSTSGPYRWTRFQR
ncbi:Mg2+ transporter protein CorA-like/Zinc transport protein ZntB [Penicillium coprophilum]|uniref:Mg2+ transporter protein CorA-like/Zinc transport protein ZntB n=1 Tax=Penicillium coprophilum TaxID=36646 RepID=UPI0023982142|nr:Mg2+ transporter protein CorA-like/Zinc transport protein ZntB [Penicillium coprophilum]KAJ5173766.1 Mg2+ transporter protein CorA-like/Zinc transport protein ZntB [Penicillium coprophilum]